MASPTACHQACRYEGIYTSRTGDRQDGLATFWRVDRLRVGEAGCCRALSPDSMCPAAHLSTTTRPSGCALLARADGAR